MEIELTADVDVKCVECGNRLEATMFPRKGLIEVSPCENCLDDAREEGRAEEEAKHG